MEKSKKSLAKRALYIAIIFSFSLVISPETSSALEWKIEKNEWRKTTNGYLLKTSNLRGSPVSIYVSCPAENYRLSILKVGFFEGAESKELKKTSLIPCINQFDVKSEKWQSNSSIETSDLSGGMYLVKISDSDGYKSFIPLIVREVSQKARAIFVVPTMTMFAYNSWSGSNTYQGPEGFNDRLRVVDFRRPFDSGFGTGKYWNYVQPLIVEIEKMGLDIAYVADTDIHFYPELLKNRNLLISAGHDEYWTKRERENVIRARKNGMNLIFFGANAGYWQSRLSKDKSGTSIVMEIYKDKAEDPDKKEATIRFRDSGYSESELNGVQYTCFPAKGAFDSFDKTFFGFKGLVKKDFNNLGTLIGPEVDETPAANKFAGDIKVVAEGKVKCGNRWIFPKIGRASMVYGTSKDGGGVFSVGTMGWVLTGLRNGAEKSLNNFVVTVTNNVVKRGITGPFSK
jgi:hypothetical protein